MVKQHTVPKLYLRNFGERAHRNDKHKRIYQYDKQECRIYHTIPNNTAWEDNFHTLTDADALKMESMLKDVEGNASSVIKHIIDAESLRGLSGPDLVTLLGFVALQAVRTPQFRNAVVGCQQHYFQALGGRQFLPDADDIPPKDIPKDEQTVTHHAKSVVGGFEFVLASLERMKATVLVNDTSMPFWTSDNPVVRHNDMRGGSRPDAIGAQIDLPLSPRIMLTLYDPTYDGLVRSASYGIYTYGGDVSMVRENVVYCNQLQFKSATRFIYSNKPIFPYAKAFQDAERMDRDDMSTEQLVGDGWVAVSPPPGRVDLGSNLWKVVYWYNVAKSESNARERFARLHGMLFIAANVAFTGGEGKALDDLVRKLAGEPNAPMERWRRLAEQMESDEDVVPSMEDVDWLDGIIAKLIWHWMCVRHEQTMIA